MIWYKLTFYSITFANSSKGILSVSEMAAMPVGSDPKHYVDIMKKEY